MNIVPVLSLILLFLLAIWFIDRIIRKEDNPLEWADLISTRSQHDNKNHADWDRIGKGAGVFIATYTPMLYAHSERFEPVGGAALVSVSLLYLGGVAGYSAWVRSKQTTTQAEK